MPIDWNDFRHDLREVVSREFDDPQQIRVIAQDVGLADGKVLFNQSPALAWHSLIQHAKTQNALPDLLRELRQWLPHNDALNSLATLWEAEQLSLSGKPYNRPLDMVDVPSTTLEKQMGTVPTFLPAAFLLAGAQAVPSVVRVRTPELCGTGFLIDHHILLTNNHVIGTPALANAGEIDLDYQTTIDGTFVTPTKLKLDSTFFQTSIEHDVTAIRVKVPSELKIRPLELSDEAARVNDRVAIIQHPEGGRKQVALHRNFVLHSDDKILQYFTDTLPGSSGSPVFDSRWRVVGIHRGFTNFSGPTSGNTVFRNEGTALATLRRLLDEWHV